MFVWGMQTESVCLPSRRGPITVSFLWLFAALSFPLDPWEEAVLSKMGSRAGVDNRVVCSRAGPEEPFIALLLPGHE